MNKNPRGTDAKHATGIFQIVAFQIFTIDSREGGNLCVKLFNTVILPLTQH